MDPTDLRAEIPACQSCAYLNTGASGPCPEPVVEAVADAQRRQEFDVCSVGHYTAAADLKEKARGAIAPHVGATPADIALVDATGDGISRIANALEWEPGDRVVRTDLEHPSGVLPWRRLAETGIEVTTVSCPEGRLPMDAYREAVEGARLVCLSSESWLHGTRLPVAEAVEIAHDAGALVVVDAVQTVGQHPIDVEAWGADVVCASGHKWLLGPWGAGFVYVAPDSLSALRPRHIGYRSVTDPTGEGLEYHPDASRLEVSTNAVAPYAGLIEAIDLLESVGMDTVEARIERLTDRLKAGLGDRCLSPDVYESGLVAFEVDDTGSFLERTEAAEIAVRDLPSGVIRASVHAFNTAEEIDALLELC
ncbi:aminotransferase class V-fold PLP-dependent enzyme [Natronomonas sp. F2-12]|jgi:selenocysteine lyase/cysteine desulfurase|uniref:Aminotransferase class V-fold PLP-dependent enzyme n=1 Tax=Natronomonas aquatica TaxID=2841590 RepID=A0A9R1D4L5_9EURY|nr:aminotransferase class V-fold PLP-dependent enzyme [Natronomonas aquatica]MCQ4333494.1 aminotransferase class V-fold PLP-dependent enzyme [Natronomonas aquatica]